jgi:phytoene desaturase
MKKLVYKPGRSLTEFLDIDVAGGIFKLDIFTSMKKHIRKYFKHPKLIQLLEFPVLFLGAMPADIPALYSLMNYADIKLGTWYPEKGMYNIVNAMHSIATELGVQFDFNTVVTNIKIESGFAKGVYAKCANENKFYEADVVIGAADYHYIETSLLEKQHRSYTNEYWDSRVLAPSCLLYYVGLNKKLKNIPHHTLFFDVDFDQHALDIYADRVWPTAPLFYVCTPSVTDNTVAPEGHENLFFLIPVAAGLKGDTEEIRNRYFDNIIKRLEKETGESIFPSVIFKRSYSVSDFKDDYNAFKGNAYGLANTLMQTAILKPSLKSRKVKNLFYTGQLTVPGPGVPPSLISGEIVAGQILKEYK